ncbi:hypothetical protein DKT77_17665 [Meridianimarinicoccus roseus]|uniref:Uncharacterized protein n=1 Tax=Meridianimarinicoccus roseus TaxID=2072018 RepID=A0A2V2LDC3_9RHOB|nr:hypothetical protein [Meridianimarinicoccus roseus]PWR01296.1 hypothetical protein DKT77_17665 [Meridianimarinicoccus roseus]
MPEATSPQLTVTFSAVKDHLQTLSVSASSGQQKLGELHQDVKALLPLRALLDAADPDTPGIGDRLIEFLQASLQTQNELKAALKALSKNQETVKEKTQEALQTLSTLDHRIGSVEATLGDLQDEVKSVTDGAARFQERTERNLNRILAILDQPV